MKIEPIQKNDIETLAYLHKKNLITPVSKIGEAYLRKFYTLILSDSKTHIYFLTREGKEITGAITATMEFRKTSELLKKIISLSLLFDVLKALLLGKVTINELIERLRFERHLLKNTPTPYPVILTLFIDQNHQRKGVGKSLVETVLKELKNRGIKKIYVDTLKTNKKAISFYQSLGFAVKDKIADSVVLEYLFI